jgi:hypothetical protein
MLLIGRWGQAFEVNSSHGLPRASSCASSVMAGTRCPPRFSVLDGDILAAVAVMNEASAMHGPAVMEGLFLEHEARLRGP